MFADAVSADKKRVGVLRVISANWTYVVVWNFQNVERTESENSAEGPRMSRWTCDFESFEFERCTLAIDNAFIMIDLFLPAGVTECTFVREHGWVLKTASRCDE